MSITRSASPKAPATSSAFSRAGLLLCSHGVHGGPGSALRHAAAIRGLGLFAEVGACCLKGSPGPAEALSRMSSPEVYLVPLLMAEGYTARRLVDSALAALPGGGGRIVRCRPVGTNPGMAAALLAAARRCCRAKRWAPGETTVIVMGHGTTRCASSGGTAYCHAQLIAREGDFAAVAPAFLDQPPGLDEALAHMTTRHAVVVGLFADRGAHGEKDVPRLLAQGSHEAVYAGPVGTAPELSSLILDQVLESRVQAA